MGQEWWSKPITLATQKGQAGWCLSLQPTWWVLGHPVILIVVLCEGAPLY